MAVAREGLSPHRQRVPHVVGSAPPRPLESRRRDARCPSGGFRGAHGNGWHATASKPKPGSLRIYRGDSRLCRLIARTLRGDSRYAAWSREEEGGVNACQNRFEISFGLMLARWPGWDAPARRTQCPTGTVRHRRAAQRPPQDRPRQRQAFSRGSPKPPSSTAVEGAPMESVDGWPLAKPPSQAHLGENPRRHPPPTGRGWRVGSSSWEPDAAVRSGVVAQPSRRSLQADRLLGNSVR